MCCVLLVVDVQEQFNLESFISVHESLFLVQQHHCGAFPIRPIRYLLLSLLPHRCHWRVIQSFEDFSTLFKIFTEECLITFCFQKESDLFLQTRHYDLILRICPKTTVIKNNTFKFHEGFQIFQNIFPTMLLRILRIYFFRFRSNLFKMVPHTLYDVDK